MRICFICGSLEPGCDGVGDYTRRLAGELIRQGVACRSIALNERVLTQPLEEMQTSEGTELPVLRLPASLSWRERARRAKAWTSEFEPDWVSLQFVPFGFQKKGLPFGLSRVVDEIAGPAKRHVMFHELWLGMSSTEPVQHTIIGLLQRYTIRRLLARLRPLRNHTHCDLYKNRLEDMGARVAQLPLFGNIPVSKDAHFAKESDVVSFAVFGNIHHSAPIDAFSDELRNWMEIYNKSITIHFLGKVGGEKHRWCESLQRQGINVVVHGLLATERVSEVLQACDYGLGTTPWLLIQKSGSVAAMLEHDLPVICVARDWPLKTGNQQMDIPGILYYCPGRLGQILSVRNKANALNLGLIAHQMFTDLNNAKYFLSVVE